MPSSETPIVNKWVVAATVMLPTFIEIVDTSVVNVSLPHIQGSLNAGVDEVSWVLTSYLVSNAIIIPITGWLARTFGRKRYLLFSIALFTISSLGCGAAPSLAFIVIMRILQGLGGGGLQPLSQAILLESFPTSERGMAMAVFGMGIVMAPIMGPVLGGWITDNWNWRWIFYINLPVGIFAVIMITLFIYDPHYIRSDKLRIDRWGLFLLTIWIGCLQIVLDKGEREDWFHSDFIISLSAISLIALVLFVVVELRSRHPVVDLKIFLNRSFAIGTLTLFTGFFCLYGSIVLLPLYLQNLMKFTAFWAGLVIGPGGIAAFVVMPVMGILMKKGVNPRYMVLIGLSTASYAVWLMSGFNLQSSFSAAVWPRLVQGFAMGLFFVPLTTVTFMGIPKESTGNATGLYNLIRNLGASFGVAFSITILTQRTQIHQNFLIEHLTPYSPTYQVYYERVLHLLQVRYPNYVDSNTVLSLIYQEVIRQAGMLGFNDAFWILSLMTACVVPLTFFFKKSQIGGSVPAAH
jgi:MFS transporter, DHA2 family, multidrug resistance protein